MLLLKNIVPDGSTFISVRRYEYYWLAYTADYVMSVIKRVSR